MLPIPHGLNLTYKIDHIFVMSYHRPLSLVSFKDRVSVPGGQNTGKTQVINY